MLLTGVRYLRQDAAGHPSMEHMNMISNRQPELPFEFDAYSDTILRAAYARSHLKIPFEAAMRVKALAICLRCLAQTLLRQRSRHG
jgi:hypothetical protein